MTKTERFDVVVVGDRPGGPGERASPAKQALQRLPGRAEALHEERQRRHG